MNGDGGEGRRGTSHAASRTRAYLRLMSLRMHACVVRCTDDLPVHATPPLWQAAQVALKPGHTEKLKAHVRQCAATRLRKQPTRGSALKLNSSKQPSVSMAADVAAALFAQMDANADGVVTKEELAAYLSNGTNLKQLHAVVASLTGPNELVPTEASGADPAAPTGERGASAPSSGSARASLRRQPSLRQASSKAMLSSEGNSRPTQRVEMDKIGFKSLKKLLIELGTPEQAVGSAANKFMLEEVARSHGCAVEFVHLD